MQTAAVLLLIASFAGCFYGGRRFERRRWVNASGVDSVIVGERIFCVFEHLTTADQYERETAELLRDYETAYTHVQRAESGVGSAES